MVAFFGVMMQKFKLEALLKQNPNAMNSNCTNLRKISAWNKIYEELIKSGMPTTLVKRLKK